MANASVTVGRSPKKRYTENIASATITLAREKVACSVRGRVLAIAVNASVTRGTQETLVSVRRAWTPAGLPAVIPYVPDTGNASAVSASVRWMGDIRGSFARSARRAQHRGTNGDKIRRSNTSLKSYFDV